MTFALFVLTSAASFAGGVRLRRRRELVCLSLAAVAFRIVLVRWQLLGPSLFSPDWYAPVEAWWAVPFGFFLLGAAARRVRTVVVRDVAAVCIGLAFVFFGILAWHESFQDRTVLCGEPGDDGVCLQSTGWSCGAAAAAMYLHSFGIRTDERTMAERCRTTPFFGTSISGMLRGLRPFVPVTADAPLYDELRGPVLVVVKLGIVGHWIVIDRATDREVQVRDPAGGRQVWPRGEFERRWTGVAVRARTAE